MLQSNSDNPNRDRHEVRPQWVVCIALILIVVIGALAFAGRAGAYQPQRFAWPQRVITYRIADKRVAKLAHYAAGVWNREHVGFKFKQVTLAQSKHPDFSITPSANHCDLETQIVGYNPMPETSHIVGVGNGIRRTGLPICGLWLQKRAVITFGAVLGLENGKRRCQLMYWITEPCTPDKPQARDRQAIKKLIRVRNRQRRQAPKSSSITFDGLRQEWVGYSEGGGAYPVPVISISVTGSWSQPFWNKLKIETTGPSGKTITTDCSGYENEMHGPYNQYRPDWTQPWTCEPLTTEAGQFHAVITTRNGLDQGMSQEFSYKLG